MRAQFEFCRRSFNEHLQKKFHQRPGHTYLAIPEPFGKASNIMKAAILEFVVCTFEFMARNDGHH